jgi:hypothetical protein
MMTRACLISIVFGGKAVCVDPNLYPGLQEYAGSAGAGLPTCGALIVLADGVVAPKALKVTLCFETHRL